MATLRGLAKLLDFPLSHILPAYWRKLLVHLGDAGTVSRA
jgi:hypothetical protein